jgi:[acyl-carrier-protein] S-malonyltransferase
MLKRALLFPGQGAQKVGMALDFAAECPEAAELFKLADRAAGLPLAKLLAEGPEEALKDTAVSQPAIVLADLAALAAFEKLHGRAEPAAAAGLSLGEYAALAAAGALSAEEALRLVALRGRLMKECCERVPGTMASILGLAADKVAACAEEARSAGVVVVANFNSPEQTVLSGEARAVEKACALCKAAGAKRAIPLKVSGAFHSPLMRPAAEKLAPEIERAEVRPARYPVVANATGAAVREPAEIRRALVAQVTAPVLWTKSLAACQALGAEEFLELGPGGVLTGLVGRTLKNVKATSLPTAEAVRKYVPPA